MIHEEERGNMLVIFREVAEGLQTLDAESRHKIVDAVLDWYTGGTGEVDGITPSEALVATMMREKQLAYASVCQKRSAAGMKSGSRRRSENRCSNKTEHVFEQNETSTEQNRTGVRTKSNSESESMSESKSESTSTSTSESERTHMCVRPTFEEVSVYCQERGGRVDARAWYDYYVSNGWRVGRNPMKDWRAAVRTWERNGVGSDRAAAKHSDNYVKATEEQIKEFSDGFKRS